MESGGDQEGEYFGKQLYYDKEYNFCRLKNIQNCFNYSEFTIVNATLYAFRSH